MAAAPCKESTLALLYGCFTLFFVLTNYSSQEVAMQSRIYQSVVKGYTSMPWSYEPTKYLDQVHSPTDLFTWMRSVFITVTFAGQPTDGKGDYCTTLYQCEETQGDCNEDSQCVGNNTCGDKTSLQSGVSVNDVYWALDDLVRWCDFLGTPIDINAASGWQDCVQSPLATASTVNECCLDPSNDMYVTKLDFFIDSNVPVVSANCPSFMSADSSCCARQHAQFPVRNESNPEEITAPVREATVGGFNRIVGIRLGMKRFELADREKKSLWYDLFPQRLAGKGAAMDPRSTSRSTEYQDTFCNDISGACYEYSYNGSYAEAGYYTVFLEPSQGEVGARKMLESLRRDGWFDAKQSVFVADIIVYNGNEDTDTFVHAAFIFQFDFSGRCAKSQEFKAFNLNYFNMSVSKYMMRFLCELCLLMFVFMFFLLETMAMKNNFHGYLNNPAHFVDLVSLILCTVVLMWGWLIQLHVLFSEFQFSDLENPEWRGITFARLEEVAQNVTYQSWLVAVNMLMLLLRAISMASKLHDNLGLMLKVLNAGMYNLLYFSAMFIMIMMGFVFFAFFTFGSDYPPMSDVLLCFNEVFSMIFGTEIYDDLAKADPTMAPIFFYAFYVLFYLVMLNMFVSIIMSGYDIVVHQLEQQKSSSSPLGAIVTEVANDILFKFNFVFGFVFSALRCVISPIISAVKACFGSSLPNVRIGVHVTARNLFGKNRDEEAEENEVDEEASNPESPPVKKAFPKLEFCRMLVFMINFVVFSYFQVRGVATYTMRVATLFPATEAAWVTDTPKRNMNFNNLSSFEDVYPWAKAAIQPLYNKPTCAYWTPGNGYYVDGDICNSSLSDRQLVQVVNGWNIGFLRSTFVRVTVVPSCFLVNEDATWSEGYSMVRKPPTVASLEQYSCLSSGGEPVDVKNSPYNWSDPGKLGPVNLEGGFALSLGTTEQECEDTLEQLFNDRFFTKNTARMTFDWVMYNGNYDMFTYSSIGFVLQNTGHLDVTTAAQAFPLNMAAGGGAVEDWRIVNLFLVVVYIMFVGFYVLELGARLLKLSRVQEPGVPSYQFLINFLSDFWNISDTVSLCVSVISIAIYIFYYSFPFRSSAQGFHFSVDPTKSFPIPNEDAKRLGMSVATSQNDPVRLQEEDWYILWQFERVQSVYFALLTCAGLNSFFIAIKTVKYVGMLDIVKVFSNTMDAGKVRITYFLIIILMQMFGCALFVSVVFGPTKGDNSLDSPVTAALTLFDWIVGTPDLSDYIRHNKYVAVGTFVLFMVQFYFVSLQLFLATMLNTYANKMGKEDKKREKDAVESKKSLRVVEYSSVEEFKRDVTIAQPKEKDEGTHVVAKQSDKDADKTKKYLFLVASVEKKGKAAGFNVQKDHEILRLNGKQEFVTLNNLDDLWEMMRNFQPLEVTFKDREKANDTFFISKKDVDNIPATVKNLWASCGAVTWIRNEVEHEERENGGAMRAREEVQEAEGEESEGEEEQDAEDDDQRDQHQKIKLKTKKRLDSLLFSRWVDRNGRREPTDHETCPLETEKNKRIQDKALWKEPVGGYPLKDKSQDDAARKNDDKDFLKERMEKMKVTGEEVWLDVLITSVEKEMDSKEFSLIPEVLRSVDQQDGEQPGGPGSVGNTGQANLKQNVNMVLKVLEYKAKKKYYDELRKESEEHVRRLDLQNQYLHEYVWELETEFARIMKDIHEYKGKKDALLRRLGGVLDPDEYADLEN